MDHIELKTVAFDVVTCTQMSSGFPELLYVECESDDVVLNERCVLYSRLELVRAEPCPPEENIYDKRSRFLATLHSERSSTDAA